MKITEELQNGWYLGVQNGQYNRMMVHSNEPLKVGDDISKDSNKKDIDTCKTLCSICCEMFGEGEEYDETFKQAAIDFTAGYSTMEEIKFELNID
jgi:hypothetical protein